MLELCFQSKPLLKPKSFFQEKALFDFNFISALSRRNNRDVTVRNRLSLVFPENAHAPLPDPGTDSRDDHTISVQIWSRLAFTSPKTLEGV